MTLISESNMAEEGNRSSTPPPPPPPPPPAPISARVSSSSEEGLASTRLLHEPRSLTPDPTTIAPALSGKEGGAATAQRTRSHVEFSADLFNHRFRQQQYNVKTPPPPAAALAHPTMPPAMPKCDYYFSQPYYPYYYRQYYLNNFGFGIGGKYRIAPSMNARHAANNLTAPYSSSSFTALPSNQFNRTTANKTNRRKSSTTKKQQQQSNKRILMNGGEFNGGSTVVPVVPRSNRKFMMAMKSTGKDNNKNREPDPHDTHLTGYSSLFLCTDDEDLNGPHHRQTAFELVEDDEQKVNGSAKKLLLTNSNSSNGAAVSVNGMILNRSDSCLNGENVNSCAISIPGHRHHHHHHPHSMHHNHHQLFGSETNSSVNSNTTINTNSTCSRSKPKSLRMILCSYVLTILVIFIISGISFACGLLAAQHFNKILFCDFSNASMSNSELNVLSTNRSPSTRNQRMSRNNKFSPNNVQPLNSTKIQFDVSTISTMNVTKEDSNNTVVTLGDSPLYPTTATMTPKDGQGSLIDLRTTTTTTSTTTIASTTIGSSISDKGKVSTRKPEISTTNPNASTYPEVTSSTIGNFLSTMIDQYNQALNETVQQTSSEAQFLIPLLNASNNVNSIMDILASNRTEIMISTTNAPDSLASKNDQSVDEDVGTLTTMAPIGDKVIEDNSTTITDFSGSNPTTRSPSVELQSKTVDDPNLTDFDSNFDYSLSNQTENHATNQEADVSNTTLSMSNESTNNRTGSIDENEKPDLSAANSTSDQPELDMTTEKNSSRIDNTTLTEKTFDLDFENSTIESNNFTTETNNTDKVPEVTAKEIEDIQPTLKAPSVQECLDNQFKCPNSNSTECWPKLRLCDGIVDCPLDRFDETNCSATDCLMNFRCGSKSISWKISNDTDGAMNGNGSFANQTIFVTEQQNLAQCIPIANKCDGIWDCADGSDELECYFSKCEPGKVLCRDNSACITGKQACDGVYNCRDRSDEAGCVDRSSCESAGKFSCDDNSLCIRKSLVCDGIPDCDNGADEKDCVTGETCRISDSKFFCQQSSECIDLAKRCDGNVDCLDYSDEDRCFESDTEDFVYAYNGGLNQWALMCVEDDFDQNDADLICSKMGMDLSRKFDKVLITRLSANSTWVQAKASPIEPSFNQTIDAPIKLAFNYSSLTFATTCTSMLALKIECDQSRCASRSFDPSSPEAVEPKPILIVDRAKQAKNGDKESSAKCLAYTLSPKWLLTSGQCLKNLLSEAGSNVMIEVDEKTLPVENIRFHPKFSIFRTRRFPDYDLALVESQNLLPTLNHSICLPSTKLDPAITCFMGNYRNGDTPFEVLESSFCNSTQHYYGSITDRHICASSQEDGLKNVCLPPFLPLICLSSKSLWYIAGFSSYQYGCDSVTGLKISPRHFLHPTLFSNLYAMKPFIDQTLSTGTYRKNRSETLNNDPHIVPVMMDARASFVVAGSDEDVQILDSFKSLESMNGKTDFGAEEEPKAQNRSIEINQSTSGKVLMENSTVTPTSEPTTVVQSVTTVKTVEPLVEDEDSELKDSLANLSAPILDFNETSAEINSTTSSEEDENQSMAVEINTVSLPESTVTESTIFSYNGTTVVEPNSLNTDHEQESDPKSMNITLAEDVLPDNSSSEASIFSNSTEPTPLAQINTTLESNGTMDKISLLYNNDNSEENETEQV